MAEKTQRTKIDLAFLNGRPLSYSSLKEFERSPAHYYHYITTKKKEFSWDKMMGSLVDCLIFSADNFDRRYAFYPKFKKDKTVNKEMFRESHPKKICIEIEDFQLAKQIAKSVRNNSSAKAFIKATTQTQWKIRFTDKATGLPIVVIIDGKGDSFAYDLKTAKDGNPDGYHRSAYDYKYHLQAGMYCRGLESKRIFVPFWHIVAEKEEPFCVSVFKDHEDFIEAGKQDFEKLLTKFAHCMKIDPYFESGYEFHSPNVQGHHTLELPYYARTKYEL